MKIFRETNHHQIKDNQHNSENIMHQTNRVQIEPKIL